jgi:hypothetical protein
MRTREESVWVTSASTAPRDGSPPRVARRRHPRRPHPRRGLSIIYVGVFLLVLIGVVSLAVDVGRVRLARAQVQNATDAAAHAAARSLPLGQAAVEDAAVAAGQDNHVIDQDDATGQRVNPGLEIFPEQDLEVGVWDPSQRTFTPLEDRGNTRTDERRAANAAYVVGRRIKARQNPIPLIFAPVVGVFSADVEQRAIAYVRGGPHDFGFVGIERIGSNGNGATIDSMVDGRNGRGGGVASDGNIDLGNGDVYGDARPGMGDYSVSQGPNSVVTGWMANLDYKLVDLYPPATVPAGAAPFTPPEKNNADYVFPPGGVSPSYDPSRPRTFKIDELSLKGNADIVVKGYVALYVTGNVAIEGTHVSNDGKPENPAQFSVYVVGAGTTVDVGGKATQYMHLYAPQSTVNVHGGNKMDFYGWIVGRTLSFLGKSNLHYDESQKDATAFKISLVR